MSQHLHRVARAVIRCTELRADLNRARNICVPSQNFCSIIRTAVDACKILSKGANILVPGEGWHVENTLPRGYFNGNAQHLALLCDGGVKEQGADGHQMKSHGDNVGGLSSGTETTLGQRSRSSSRRGVKLAKLYREKNACFVVMQMRAPWGVPILDAARNERMSSPE